MVGSGVSRPSGRLGHCRKAATIYRRSKCRGRGRTRRGVISVQTKQLVGVVQQGAHQPKLALPIGNDGRYDRETCRIDVVRCTLPLRQMTGSRESNALKGGKRHVHSGTDRGEKRDPFLSYQDSINQCRKRGGACSLTLRFVKVALSYTRTLTPQNAVYCDGVRVCMRFHQDGHVVRFHYGELLGFIKSLVDCSSPEYDATRTSRAMVKSSTKL